MAILAWGFSGQAWPAGELREVPHSRSLKADARLGAVHSAPLMVLFASPGCHFCAKVKTEYLIPMLNDPTYRHKVVIRLVEVGSNAPLVGFDGKQLTEGEFAAESNVFMVPTIKFFDARGREVAKGIVGLLIPDYYQGFLDAGIEAGSQNIKEGKAYAETN
ncbi:MAG: thioredoxin fold domain-containing protein [Thiobacillaceae bacterium]